MIRLCRFMVFVSGLAAINILAMDAPSGHNKAQFRVSGHRQQKPKVVPVPMENIPPASRELDEEALAYYVDFDGTKWFVEDSQNPAEPVVYVDSEGKEWTETDLAEITTSIRFDTVGANERNRAIFLRNVEKAINECDIREPLNLNFEDPDEREVYFEVCFKYANFPGIILEVNEEEISAIAKSWKKHSREGGKKIKNLKLILTCRAAKDFIQAEKFEEASKAWAKEATMSEKAALELAEALKQNTFITQLTIQGKNFAHEKAYSHIGVALHQSGLTLEKLELYKTGMTKGDLKQFGGAIIEGKLKSLIVHDIKHMLSKEDIDFMLQCWSTSPVGVFRYFDFEVPLDSAQQNQFDILQRKNNPKNKESEPENRKKPRKNTGVKLQPLQNKNHKNKP